MPDMNKTNNHLTTKISLAIQIAVDNQFIPTKKEFMTWVSPIFTEHTKNLEICIRIVDEKESVLLNQKYREKNHPTNILSFLYEKNDNVIVGDLVVCAKIIEKEAIDQNTPSLAHWAHIIIHGCLHLMGHDHKTIKQAKIMEDLEGHFLQNLGYNNPYMNN